MILSSCGSPDRLHASPSPQSAVTSAAVTTTEEVSEVSAAETSASQSQTAAGTVPPQTVQSEAEQPSHDRLPLHTLGSAEELSGRTVVVSVFAEDINTRWELDDRRNDLELYYSIYDYLRIAVQWITDRGAEYGVDDIEFIWDWDRHDDLFCWAYFNADFPAAVENGMSETYAWDHIKRGIDSEALLEKYDADNIIYMMYFNTPYSNPVSACTRNYYEGMPEPYEICYMFMKDNNYGLNPGVFAHEILHTFGAPDLYGEDPQYGITEEYAQYAAENRTNDIMRFVGNVYTYEVPYDRIVNEITEITAYYLGWTDSSETVTEWGFLPSEHHRR